LPSATATGYRSPSTFLQDVVLRILPFEICQRAYPFDTTTKDQMVCAGRISGGIDTCRVWFSALFHRNVFLSNNNLQ